MKAKHKALIICLWLIASAYSGVCQDTIMPERAGRIADGQLILRYNPQWDEEERNRFAELFDLDNQIIEALQLNNLLYINDSTDWTADLGQEGFIEMALQIGRDPTDPGKIILSGLPDQQTIPAYYRLPATYGVNAFSRDGVFSYQDEVACFLLPRRQRASSVILSGSFNQWSTMQLPMQQTDQGWNICISLPPGKYHYKYIVDGRWMADPNNRLREPDGHRGMNSVIYGYNHVFFLEGHQQARRVVVTGNFNNWDTRELFMYQTATGWALPIYLGEGTHAYKFIVDGQWITDPANPVTRYDSDGNLNSFLGIGDSLIVRLNGHRDAGRVIFSGSFNNWSTNELPMEKTDSGWEIPYVLGTGNHEYKFIVDGQWITDPENPFTIGSGHYMNSVLAFGYNHVFVLHDANPDQHVYLTGSFNDWNPNGYRMVHDGGVWLFPLYLQPGRHSYKFIVDGEWILDPANPLWEENRFGTDNSVLWME